VRRLRRVEPAEEEADEGRPVLVGATRRRTKERLATTVQPLDCCLLVRPPPSSPSCLTRGAPELHRPLHRCGVMAMEGDEDAPVRHLHRTEGIAAALVEQDARHRKSKAVAGSSSGVAVDASATASDAVARRTSDTGAAVEVVAKNSKSANSVSY